MTAGDWAAGAVCRTTDPGPWMSDSAADQARAVEMCQRCPVIEACLAYAKARDGAYPFYVYGGRSGKQRRADRKQARLAAAP